MKDIGKKDIESKKIDNTTILKLALKFHQQNVVTSFTGNKTLPLRTASAHQSLLLSPVFRHTYRH